MYWRQVVASMLVAIGAFYWLAGAGLSGPAALLAALVVGVGARIGLATAARTVWWLRRGTKGIYTEYCPNCRGKRYRGRGDWMLTCHRCGWRPGWPVVRWFTRSVPAIQLRRSVRQYVRKVIPPGNVIGPGAFFVALFGLLLYLVFAGAGTVPGAVTDTAPTTAPDSGTVDRTSRPTTTAVPTASATPTPSATVTPLFTDTEDASIPPKAVENEFLHHFNSWRTNHGLPNVSTNPKLTEMGREHSLYMADVDKLTHKESGGVGIEDRYRERGLLPKCRIPIEGSDRYYPGAENAGQTWVGRSLSDSQFDYISTPEALARHLLRMWLNSPPHRKPLNQPALDEIGLGIVITEDGKVWAALEMC